MAHHVHPAPPWQRRADQQMANSFREDELSLPRAGGARVSFSESDASRRNSSKMPLPRPGDARMSFSENAASRLSYGEIGAADQTRWDYFLSHKKQHSLHGGVPAQIARNIHDNLTLLGYNGWFDVDNLDSINEAALRDAISKCDTMIVLFNDETADSEWCCFEWRVAAEVGVPLKIIVDMERCSKALALDKLRERAPPAALAHQLSELTERHRRDCLVELCAFVDREAQSANEPRRPSMVVNTSGVDDAKNDGIGIGGERKSIFHLHFERVLFIAGVPLRPPTSGLGKKWFLMIRLCHALVFCAALANLLYDSGPSFNHAYPALFLVMVFPVVSFRAWRLLTIYRSAYVSGIIVGTLNSSSTCVEISDRVRARTKRHARRVLVYAGLGSLAVVVPHAILLWHPFYLSDPHRADRFVFGISVGIAVVFFVPFNALLMLTAVTKTSILLSLSRIHLEAAFDVLHPKIKALGVKRYLKNINPEVLDVSAEALAAFKLEWLAGLRHYQHVNDQLVPIQFVHFLYSMFTLLIPTVLWMQGYHVRDWSAAHTMRIFGMYAVGPPFFLFEIKALRSSTLSLARITRDAGALVFAQPTHSLFVDSTCGRSSALVCNYAGVLPITQNSYCALTLIPIASAVPWFFMCV